MYVQLKQLDDQNTQCCYIKMEKESEIFKSSPKSLSDISKIVNTQQFKQFVKEVYGFTQQSMTRGKKMGFPEMNALLIIKRLRA